MKLMIYFTEKADLEINCVLVNCNNIWSEIKRPYIAFNDVNNLKYFLKNFKI